MLPKCKSGDVEDPQRADIAHPGSSTRQTLISYLNAYYCHTLRDFPLNDPGLPFQSLPYSAPTANGPRSVNAGRYIHLEDGAFFGDVSGGVKSSRRDLLDQSSHT